MNEQEIKAKSVPLLVYESEMKHKTNIIKGLFAIIISLLIILGIVIYLFMSFINAHDFYSYDQDGEGINNINSGTQGDLINESTIKSDE